MCNVHSVAMKLTNEIGAYAVAGIVGLMIYKKMSKGTSATDGNLLGMREWMNMPGSFAGMMDNPDAIHGNENPNLAGMRDWMEMPGQIAQKMISRVPGIKQHDLLGQHWQLLGE